MPLHGRRFTDKYNPIDVNPQKSHAERAMTQDGTLLQIYLALLLAFAAAVFSSPVVHEAMAQRHPRPLSVVMKEVADGMATEVAAPTD